MESLNHLHQQLRQIHYLVSMGLAPSEKVSAFHLLEVYKHNFGLIGWASLHNVEQQLCFFFAVHVVVPGQVVGVEPQLDHADVTPKLFAQFLGLRQWKALSFFIEDPDGLAMR